MKLLLAAQNFLQGLRDFFPTVFLSPQCIAVFSAASSLQWSISWVWFHLVVAGWELLSWFVTSSSQNTYIHVDGHAPYFLLDFYCSDNWESNIHVTGSWSIIYNELIAKFIYYD